MKNLKKILKEEYPFIENAIEESFIKLRSFSTTAVFLTFSLQTYNIYIPGRIHVKSAAVF